MNEELGWLSRKSFFFFFDFFVVRERLAFSEFIFKVS